VGVGTGDMPGCQTPPDAGPPLDGGLDGGSLDAGADASSLDASSGVQALVSFSRDIHPIFVQRCGPCHVSEGFGGHNVGGPDVAAAYSDAVREASNVISLINGNGMPPSYAPVPNNCADGDGPGDPGCVSVADFGLIQTWIAQCYPR